MRLHLQQLLFENHFCMSVSGLAFHSKATVCLFCRVSQHSLYSLDWRCNVCLKLQSLLFMGDSPCGYGLKHYFNYKSVRSFNLLESNVIFFSVSFCVGVALNASMIRVCSLPAGSKRGQTHFDGFCFFFCSCFVNTAKSGPNPITPPNLMWC